MTILSRLRPLGLAVSAIALLGTTAMATAETIVGSSWSQIIRGTDGADKIEGRDGNDDIRGRNGDDDLSGNAGDDILNGGAGNDHINGDGGCSDSTADDEDQDDCDYASGSDVIIGGLGADNLFGGGGANVFIYNSVEESPAGKGKSDTISLRAVDPSEKFPSPLREYIDLRRIDANAKKAGRQHFTFIGKKPFSGKPGELRVSNTNVLMGDTTGSGKANFAIKVKIYENNEVSPYSGEGLLLK